MRQFIFSKRPTITPLPIQHKRGFLFLFAIIIFSIVLGGCSEMQSVFNETQNGSASTLFTQEERNLFRYLDSNFTFDETEARKHAMDIAFGFDKIDGLKRSVKELLVVNLPLNKGGSYIKIDSTPELYVYNFKPSGFAIIGADERSLGEMLSFMSSTIDEKSHTGYQILVEGAVAKVSMDREEFYRQKDSIAHTQAFINLERNLQHYFDAQHRNTNTLISGWVDGMFKFIATPAYAQSTLGDMQRVYGGYFKISYVGQTSSINTTITNQMNMDTPLLRTNFHQRFPYQGAMPIVTCKDGTRINASAGCVQIAYAQILLYYNTKKTNQRVINLDSLYQYHYKNTGYSHVEPSYHNQKIDMSSADLIRKIYDFQNTSKDPGCKETGVAVPDNGQRSQIVNNDWGFQPAYHLGLNHEVLTESIKQGKPVFLSGFTDRERVPIRCIFFFCWGGGEYGRGSGHAWVVDGIRAKKVSYRIETQVYDKYLLTPNASNWTMTATWPVGTSSVSFQDKIELVSTDIHNNWGWGESFYLDQYRNSEWAKKDIYIPQQLGMSYHFQYVMRMLANITPL